MNLFRVKGHVFVHFSCISKYILYNCHSLCLFIDSLFVFVVSSPTKSFSLIWLDSTIFVIHCVSFRKIQVLHFEEGPKCLCPRSWKFQQETILTASNTSLLLKPVLLDYCCSKKSTCTKFFPSLLSVENLHLVNGVIFLWLLVLPQDNEKVIRDLRYHVG